MPKKFCTLSAALFTAVALSQTSHAAPIALTFESLAGTSNVADFGPLPNPFAESGFQFAFDSHPTPEGFDTSFYFIGPIAPCIGECTSNGTSAFFEFNDGVLSLTRAGGGTFSLLSLDAAQAFLSVNAPLDLHVTGLLSGGGTVDAVLKNDAALTFSTYTLPSTFSNLLSVSFTGSSVTESLSSNFVLDNVVVDPLPEKEAVPVPEPASALLFGAGLFGFLMRRPRQSERSSLARG